MEENVTRKSPKRLLIDISEELHTEIRLRAARQYISMRKYVIKAILEAIKKEKQYE